jgi:hypothetical protein
MNPNVKRKIVTGMLLAASVAGADVVVDDFHTGWAGRNNFNGLWIADADSYVCNPVGSTNCGTSTVVDPVLGEDVVKNSANVASTYDGTGSIISKIKVSKDVSATQAWAYAGWVMDFLPADTTGAGPEPWNQPQWDRKNEVDISGCTALQVKIQFDPNKQIWIEVYNPQQEKANPSAPPPQYGWRRYTSGTEMQTFNLALTGLGSPVQKWTGTATDPKIDLKHINRIKFLYEGQVGSTVAVPAPYDALQHTFAIGGVTLVGPAPACNIKGQVGIRQDGTLTKIRLSVSETAGMLSFNNLSGLGDLKVEILDLNGKVMSKGIVGETHSTMQVSGMKNGVYAVKVTGASFGHTYSFTHLN